MPVGLFLPGPGPYVELGLGKAPDGLVSSRAFPTTGRLENPSNPGGNGDNVSPLDGWNTVYAGNVGTWQRLNAHYALQDTHNEPGVVALTSAAWRGTSYADTSGFLAEAPQFSEVEVWATMVSTFTDLTLGTNAEVLVSCHIDPADGGFGVSSEDAYPYDEGVFGGIADHGSGPVLTLFYQDFSQTRPYTVDSAAISPVAGCSFGLYAHPANGDGTYTVDLYYAPNGSDWPVAPNLTLTYTPDFAGSPPGDRTGGVPGLIGIAARSIGSAVSNNGTEIFSQFGGGTPVVASGGGGATSSIPFTGAETSGTTFGLVKTAKIAFTAAETSNATIAVKKTAIVPFTSAETSNATFGLRKTAVVPFAAAETSGTTFALHKTAIVRFTAAETSGTTFALVKTAKVAWTAAETSNATFSLGGAKSATFTSAESSGTTFSLVKTAKVALTAAETSSSTLGLVKTARVAWTHAETSGATLGLHKTAAITWTAAETGATAFGLTGGNSTVTAAPFVSGGFMALVYLLEIGGPG